MYSAEKALEQIWNDSGNEGDLFDSNESEFEMYKASKVTSSVLMPLHEGKIVHKTLRRQGPTNTRPGRPRQAKKIAGQVFHFSKKPAGH